MSLKDCKKKAPKHCPTTTTKARTTTTTTESIKPLKTSNPSKQENKHQQITQEVMEEEEETDKNYRMEERKRSSSSNHFNPDEKIMDAKQNKLQRKMDDEKTTSDDKNKQSTATTTTTTATSGSSLSTTISTNIFKYFNILTNSRVCDRLETIVGLIQHLQRHKNPELRRKELQYSLKRVIRGCGASTNISRAGFFTCLVALLKTFEYQELRINEIYDIMCKELQVNVNKCGNREDADAITGQLLVCGAILRTNKQQSIFLNNEEYYEKLIKIIVMALQYRSYHVAIGYNLLTDIIQTSSKSIESSELFIRRVWPLLLNELDKTWSQQTINTMYCCLLILKHFPQLKIHRIEWKFFSTSINGNRMKQRTDDFLLNPENYKHLYRIFWQQTKMDMLMHPVYNEFIDYISKRLDFKQFWLQIVDKELNKRNNMKFMELITVKMLTHLFEQMKCHNNSKEDDVDDDCKPLLNPLDFLTYNFIQSLINGLKSCKNQTMNKRVHDGTTATTTTTTSKFIKQIYKDFLQSLINCYGKLNDKQRVELIKRLIMPTFGGAFNIEKYTENRLIHQLINGLETEEGVQELYTIYKDVFKGGEIVTATTSSSSSSSSTILNVDRLNAGYMLQQLLQHKACSIAYKWRRKELEFLMIHGIFHMNERDDICPESDASSFSKHFGDQCKQIFYTCLQSRNIDLTEEQKLLQKLMQQLHKKLLLNGVVDRRFNVKHLRIEQFDENLQNSWLEMYRMIEETNLEVATNKMNKLLCVFQIFLLHMGFQLFRETEMATIAIDDLINCLKRIDSLQTIPEMKSKESPTTNNEEEKKKKVVESVEPHWIDVIIDLILHLLSQNNHTLRHLVGVIFPHICDGLTMNALQQILSMLDMKDGRNPLIETTDNNHSEEDDDNDNNDKDNHNDNDDDDDDKSDASTIDGEEEEGDEDDEEEEDDDEEEEEEDEDEDDEEEYSELEGNEDDLTATDKLRNAISLALIENGAAAGIPNGGGGGGGGGGATMMDASIVKNTNQNNDDNDADDDDGDSIDLNDLTEEQGRRLDEALAVAFKNMKRTTGTLRKSREKRNKRIRIEKTTLMHFRIRVLDLLEIFIRRQQQQQQLNWNFENLRKMVEIMLALLNMLQYCSSDESLRPLHNKAEKLLLKLTSHNNSQQHPQQQQQQQLDVREDNMESVTISSIISKTDEKDFIEYVRNLFSYKMPSIHFEMMNRYRNKCITFLLLQWDHLQSIRMMIMMKRMNNDTMKRNRGEELLTELFYEYVMDYLMNRNSNITMSLLTDIVQIRCCSSSSSSSSSSNNNNNNNSSIQTFIQTLVKNGLHGNVRVYRRIQILELLQVLYRKGVDSRNASPSKFLLNLEKHIDWYMKQLFMDAIMMESIQQNTLIPGGCPDSDDILKWRTSPKECQMCLELLLTVQKYQNQVDNHYQSLLLTKDMIKLIVDMVETRFKTLITSLTIYKRFKGLLTKKTTTIITIPITATTTTTITTNSSMLSNNCKQNNNEEIIDENNVEDIEKEAITTINGLNHNHLHHLQDTNQMKKQIKEEKRILMTSESTPERQQLSRGGKEMQTSSVMLENGSAKKRRKLNRTD